MPKLPKELHDLRRLDALIVCLSHSWGGLEQVAVSDALEIARLGLPVRFLAIEGSPVHRQLAQIEGEAKLRVVPIAYKVRNFMDFHLRSTLHELMADGVNLIHTHQTTLLGSIIPWLWGRPHVAAIATRHIMNDHNKRDFFHRAIYARLDALLVMSQTLKRNVLDTHPISPAHVRTVNLGLDFERFDPKQVHAEKRRKQWEVEKSTIVIGLVGRIDPAKGQATFIRAAAGLVQALGEKHDLLFLIVGQETIGSEAGHLAELQELVAQFHLEESVRFSGYEENIPEVMRALDIMVMPSREEAFGLVAIEAMAMECPVIISNRGSAREIVGDDEFGLTVRPDDAFDLQRQLKTLIESPKLRDSMGKKARAHVLAHYDKKVRIQKTVEVYDRAIRRRSPFKRGT
jgi:glycosyltransferase involved in cell wall biosynthesis